MSNPSSFTLRVCVPEHVLVRELSGDSVLLNLDSECYFGMDATATGMWQALTASSSVEAAYGHLLDDYDVDEARLREDLREFVERLLEQGLIEICSG